MLLNELFTKPLPYKVKSDDEDSYAVTSYDPDGNKYFFVADKSDREDIDSWFIHFYAFDKEGKLTSQMLGGRKSIPVFSTVIELVLKVIKKNDPDEVYFTARKSEESRVSLYRRFAHMLANHLNWKLRELPLSSEITFSVSKPKLEQAVGGSIPS